MREVRLIAVSDDGTQLILSGDDHERLALQIDETLHAAIRGDRARVGQLEIQLENQLRPKDIQTRIRAGESVEAVAAVAGMPLEKVRRFAGPVLAERVHIAERARQATIRRVNGDGAPRVLDDVASSAAAAVGVDPVTIEWDAWRRDDGRWQVQCSWQPAEGDVTAAVFSFDPSGRSVVAEDDGAHAVAGDLPRQPDPVPDGSDDQDDADAAASEGAPVRLAVVPAPPDYYPVDGDDDLQVTLPQGVVGLDQAADAPSAAATTSVDERRARRAARARTDRRRSGEAAALSATDTHAPSNDAAVEVPSDYATTGASADHSPSEAPAEADDVGPDRDEPVTDRLHLSEIATRVEDDTSEPAPKPAKPTRSRSRRPSVPSWDEIMFGRGKSSE